MSEVTCSGFLDGIAIRDDKIIFSGWASCLGLSRPIVTVICDEKPIVSGIANIYREDLVNVISHDGHNGFELTTPVGVVNGYSDIQVIIHSADGYGIINTNHAIKALPFEEEVTINDYVCPLTKIIYEDNEDKVTVNLIDGKIMIDTLTSDVFKNDFNVEYKEYSLSVGGVLIDLDKYFVNQNKFGIITKSLIEIPIEIPMLGQSLRLIRREKIIYENIISYDSRYKGYLEEAVLDGDYITISGWAIDLYKKFERKKIKIIVSDGINKIEDYVLSELYRGDLERHLGYGSIAFKTTVNVSSLEGDIIIDTYIVEGNDIFSVKKTNKFSVVDNSNNMTESFLEASEADEIIGSIDGINDNILSGWARNNTNLRAPVLLDIYLDGKLFVSTWANRYRPDLEKHFGDHGCHAFQVDFATNINAFTGYDISVKPRVGISSINHRISALEEKVSMKHISEEIGL